MNNLMEIKTTKTSFLKMESELLIVGLFKDKKLSAEDYIHDAIEMIISALAKNKD